MDSMDKPEVIGMRIRQARKALGLTQIDVCERLGVHPPTWNNFERGRRLPRYPAIVAFCDEYGVTMDWIFRGNRASLPLHLAQKILDQESYRSDHQEHIGKRSA